VLQSGLLGPRLRALLLFMKGALHLSYSGLQEFLLQGLGLKLSRGYLAKVMVQGTQALAAPLAQLRRLLPQQPVLNVEETGDKENGQRMWTWCFRAPHFVRFAIRPAHSSDVLLELLATSFVGALGCDYFSAYRKFLEDMKGGIQFCLAHLIRDVKLLAEHPDVCCQLYAQPLLRALGRLFTLIHQQTDTPHRDRPYRLARQKQRILQLPYDAVPMFLA